MPELTRETASRDATIDTARGRRAEPTAQGSVAPEFVRLLRWPTLALIVVVVLAGPLRGFLERAGKVDVKADQTGFAVSIQEKLETAAALGAAAASRSSQSSDLDKADGGTTPPASVSPVNTREIAKTVEAAPGGLPNLVARTGTVLWVDDRLHANRYETEALRSFGLRVVQVQTTDEGLQTLREQPIAVVISDMKRGNETTAGYTLLEKMRSAGLETPVIFYTASATKDFIEEARRRGAFGETNVPTELFRLVTEALRREQ